MIDYSKIPERILLSLNAYALEGRPTGHFLRMVLENNLCCAFQHADDECAGAMRSIVAYVYNRLPDHCWGSSEKVYQWLRRPKEYYKQFHIGD
jgi:hypothetical protein